jgi:hypothetical protein
MRGKERPPVPNIPGVARGKIEAQRDIWASRRRVGFVENKADLLVIEAEKEFFLDLPVLGIPESRLKPGQLESETDEEEKKRRLHYAMWMPRVEPESGAIFITRWGNPAKALEERNLVAFGGRKSGRNIEIKDAPKSWDIAWLIPERHPTIESGMRLAEELLHDMGVTAGVEQRRVEEFLAALNGISEAFLHRPELSPLDIEGLSRQADQLLSYHGLANPRDPHWRKIRDYTLRATSNLGVRYPQASRILARAAYLAAVNRELIQTATWEKASNIFFYLGGIRGDTRGRIDTATTFLDNMGGFAFARGASVLTGEERWIQPREALPVEHATRKMVRTVLRPVEAAPYVHAARIAEAILVGKFGKSNEKIRQFRELLDERGRYEFGRESAVGYLRNRDAFSTRQRFRHAFNGLREVNADLDTLETTVFD